MPQIVNKLSKPTDLLTQKQNNEPMKEINILKCYKCSGQLANLPLSTIHHAVYSKSQFIEKSGFVAVNC